MNPPSLDMGRLSPIQVIVGENEDTDEIDMLRASIKQLQKERDAALNELNLFKLNNKL